MIFNGIDFKDDFIVENINRSLLPPISTRTAKINGRAGHKYIENELNPLTINVGIRILAKDRAELQQKVRELTPKLYTKEPRELYLDDEVDKYNLAILDGETEIEKIGMTGKITLLFLCLDPLAYEINASTKILSTSTQINNTGTYDAVGIITVNIGGSQSFLEVLQFETGDKIYIEHNFVLGDEVVIDLENESVKKNGNLIMSDIHLISDFFKIPIGLSTIKLSSGSGILEYRQRWL